LRKKKVVSENGTLNGSKTTEEGLAPPSPKMEEGSAPASPKHTCREEADKLEAQSAESDTNETGDTKEKEDKSLDSGRRSERQKRHKAPPMGLFSSVFFQYGSGTQSLRIGGRTLRRVHTDPNIFLIDSFLTEHEMLHLDRLLTPARFVKSYTDAEDGRKVVDEDRTSTFTHLGKSQDTHIRQIESRAATLIGMPADMVEPLQVVQYSEGQKFETHHDIGTLGPDNKVECVFPPRRLATFFIYLNSLPAAAGGHTEFPLLNLKITPVRGQVCVLIRLYMCPHTPIAVFSCACTYLYIYIYCSGAAFLQRALLWRP